MSVKIKEIVATVKKSISLILCQFEGQGKLLKNIRETMKNGYPTGSSDFTSREHEILHFAAPRCIDIYTAMNLSLI